MQNSNSIRKIGLPENLGYATRTDAADIRMSAAAQYSDSLIEMATFSAACAGST